MIEKRGEPFHWFQCAICGKLLDSDSAREAHEKRCRERERELLLRSAAAASSLEREQ